MLVASDYYWTSSAASILLMFQNADKGKAAKSLKDIYDKLAFGYDEFGHIADYLAAEQDFFENLLTKANVKTVLDCG